MPSVNLISRIFFECIVFFAATFLTWLVFLLQVPLNLNFEVVSCCNFLKIRVFICFFVAVYFFFRVTAKTNRVWKVAAKNNWLLFFMRKVKADVMLLRHCLMRCRKGPKISKSFFFEKWEKKFRMAERASRVGIKLEPPTLIVIYSLELDGKQTRIRKIPIKVKW